MILSILVASSLIHDSIYRKLIDETNDDDQESYSSNVRFYNSLIHTIHFIIPFIINLCSVIILIKKKATQQSHFNKKQSYKTILLKQIRKHKHLIVSPIVLVLVGIPRLIFIFISKCMNSSNDSWLFLAAYFISFIS